MMLSTIYAYKYASGFIITCYEYSNMNSLFPENQMKEFIPIEYLLGKMTLNLIQIAYFLYWDKEKWFFFGHT